MQEDQASTFTVSLAAFLMENYKFRDPCMLGSPGNWGMTFCGPHKQSFNAKPRWSDLAFSYNKPGS